MKEENFEKKHVVWYLSFFLWILLITKILAVLFMKKSFMNDNWFKCAYDTYLWIIREYVFFGNPQTKVWLCTFKPSTYKIDSNLTNSYLPLFSTSLFSCIYHCFVLFVRIAEMRGILLRVLVYILLYRFVSLFFIN